jgi:O-antigen/teichoic acid export membrane protein
MTVDTKSREQFSHLVARNSAVGLAGQLATKLLSFGFSVLIVRHLGAEAYGQYAAVLSFGTVFVFLADLGLNLYAVRQVARWRDENKGHAQVDALYGDLFAIRFLLTLLTISITLVVAWLTERPPVMVGAIALSALGLLMYSLQGPCEALLFGFERADLVARAKVLAQLAFVLAGAAALLLGHGYYGLIVANLLGIALMTVSCWRAVVRLGVRQRGIMPRSWSALLRASLPFAMIGFMLGLSYKFDTILLNVFRGDVETGYYNAAYNLVFSAALLSNVLNTSLYPSLARQAASAPERMAAICGQALRYLMLLALPLTLGGCFLADRVVLFLYTSEYVPASSVLRIVIWVVPLMFASEFLQYVALVRGQEWLVARSLTLSTGLNVMLNLLLVPRYGIQAAALVTVLTEVVLVGRYGWIQRSLLREVAWGRVFWRPLVAALLMGGLAYELNELPFFVVLPLAALVYAALALPLGIVSKSEVDSARRLTVSSALLTSRRLRQWTLANRVGEVTGK